MMNLDHVGGDRGAGQQEVAESFTVIHLEPNGIPEFRGKLPLVNQARRLTLE